MESVHYLSRMRSLSQDDTTEFSVHAVIHAYVAVLGERRPAAYEEHASRRELRAARMRWRTSSAREVGSREKRVHDFCVPSRKVLSAS